MITQQVELGQKRIDQIESDALKNALQFYEKKTSFQRSIWGCNCVVYPKAMGWWWGGGGSIYTRIVSPLRPLLGF